MTSHKKHYVNLIVVVAWLDFGTPTARQLRHPAERACGPIPAAAQTLRFGAERAVPNFINARLDGAKLGGRATREARTEPAGSR